MKKQPEVIAAHACEQLSRRGGRSPVRVVLAQNQLLAVRRLDPLVVKLQPWQLHAHAGQQQRAPQGPGQCHPDEGMRNGTDEGQRSDFVGQRPQHRQKGPECHEAAHEAQAQVLHGAGETHGVLLHPLCRALDVPQAWPGGHVVLIHRLAPAEDVVFAEKIHQHRRRHINHGNACKGRKLPPELLCGDAAGLSQSLLDQVVKAAEPVVDLHVQLHTVSGGQKNDDRTEE